MESLWQDIRFGIRTLAKSPTFTAIAVVTLALGIGLNTTMFSVVNGILLSPLPYAAQDRLVLIRISEPGSSGSFPSVSPPEVIDFEERLDIFDAVGSIRDGNGTLTGEGDPEQLLIGGMRWNFLSVLGIEPILGRAFTADDGTQGAGPKLMLSYGLWQSKFGADPNIVEKPLQIDGIAHEVIGVLPQNVELLLPREAGLPKNLDAWRPFTFDFATLPRFRWQRAVGRLKEGVTIGQARAAMDGLAIQLVKEEPFYEGKAFHYFVEPLQGDLVRQVRGTLWLLFGAVGFVLLIACANVANLLLTRSSAREGEVAIRTALGASRTRIIRQMLTESAVLALVGGAAGLLLALWGVELVRAYAPQNLPRLNAIGLEPRVFAFTLLASMLTVLLFGLVPALYASRPSLTESLKDGGARTTAGAARNRLRNVMVVAEIALSLLLLLGAGLMMRSFASLLESQPGFDRANLVTFQLQLPFQRYPLEQTEQFFEILSQRVTEQAGIENFGGSFPLPLSGRFWTNTYLPDSLDESEWGHLESDNHAVWPGYFKSVGARLHSGRYFTWSDIHEDRNVIIIDAKLAAKNWPGENPLGKKVNILLPNNARGWQEVIGVIEHVRKEHPGREGREQTYVLSTQWGNPGASLTVRSHLSTEETMALIREEVREMDAELAIFNVRTMNELFSDTTAGNRFAFQLMGVFAGMAVLLAGIGLYGTISYSVAQRRHELGIRMALGADSRDVFRLVVGHGLKLTLAGLAAGLIAALAFGWTVSSFLFGVSAYDLPTYAAVTTILATTALLASYVPARRATQADPMNALRYE